MKKMRVIKGAIFLTMLLCSLTAAWAVSDPVPVGKYLRAEELINNGENALKWMETARKHYFKDFKMSGLDLKADQAELLEKIVMKYKERFLTQKEVQALFSEIKDYIHSLGIVPVEISYSIENEVFKVEIKP